MHQKNKAVCWGIKSAFSACPAFCYFSLAMVSIEPNANSFLILDSEIDASNYDQLNSMDFLCTVENDENGDELYPSSNAREAYARIGMKTFF